MKNNLASKMDNYKIEIRKNEYKKILENSRKRIIFSLNKKKDNIILDKNPLEKLKIFEKDLEMFFKEKKNFNKILEITKKINNYLELFKNENNEVFSLFITDTKIFDIFLEIVIFYSENFFTEKINKKNFEEKIIKRNFKEKIQKNNFQNFEKNNFLIFLNEILDIICILTIVDFSTIKILLEKNLLEFFIFLIKNFDINLKEIIWSLSNLADSEKFVILIFKNYENLINFFFLEFDKNLDKEKKNLFTWFFSTLFRNSKNLNKENFEKILNNISILQNSKNLKIQEEIIFSLQSFLEKSNNSEFKIYYIKKFHNLEINNFIINSLDSEKYKIYHNSLKCIYYLSINSKEILKIFFNENLKNNLINFLDNENLLIRKITLSIILNFLLTDFFFLENFFSNRFLNRIFYIFFKDEDFSNIILALKIIDSFFNNDKLDFKILEKIIDFKIIDVLFKCFEKNKNEDIILWIFYNFENILKLGENYQIEGQNLFIFKFKKNKLFQFFLEFKSTNIQIIQLKHKIEQYFDFK